MPDEYVGVLQSLKNYLTDADDGCPVLLGGRIVGVDHLDGTSLSFSIIPLPGSRIVEFYLNDATIREFPFALQASISTEDEATRLENNAIFEQVSHWLDQKVKSDQLPEMEDGKTAEEISANDSAFLFEQGESNTGIYQIQGMLRYHQEPVEALA